MGFWDQLFRCVQGVTRKVNLLVVGLDASGKTTILRKLDPYNQDTGSTAPTIGTGEERFYLNQISFNCFDMSGQSKYRPLWEQNLEGADAIIFVIDASDRIRFGVALDEFEGVMEAAAAKGKFVPVLVFANKMDLPDAADPIECSNVLKLDSVVDRSWQIIPSCAISGDGLLDGVAWITEKLAK